MPASDLLPDEAALGEQFRSLSYWDSFFRERGEKAFEWYSSWPQLRPLLRAACGADQAGAQPPHGGRLLVVGCGNSELSAQLYDDGFEDVLNVDFSRVCIAEMLRKHARSRPRMRWQVQDATALKLPDSSFDTVVDKGMLDALTGEPGEASEQAGEKLLSECSRVCAPGGVLLLVSLLQPHVLSLLLRSFRQGWRARISQVPASADMFTSPLQAFLVELRSEPTALAPPVELRLIAGVAVNAEQAADVKRLVAAENAGRAGPLASGLLAGGDPFRELHPARFLPPRSLGPTPGRFLVCAVDAASEDAALAASSGQPRPPPKAAAVFLVPQGREHEWLFSSAEGARQLAASCAVGRLLLVSLGRGHAFGDAKAVQAELSPLVLPLLPAAVRSAPTGAVPFLTTQAGLGRRTLVAQAESVLSGTVDVEDVDGEPDDDGAATVLRRLVFSANVNLIQSEARLVGGAVDASHLSCAYQASIVAALALAAPQLLQPSEAQPTICVIGLGGGALPVFLHDHLPLRVRCVELDPTVAELAKSAFGFTPGPRLELVVGDGLDVIAAAPAQSLAALVVDAGSNDASLGMSCPPAAFLEAAFLQAARRALTPDGTVLVNVVARSESAFAGALQAARAAFGTVLCVDVEGGDLNRVLVMREQPLPSGWGGEQAAKALRAARMKPWSETTDVEALCRELDASSTCSH
jgi:SAM-dependent methyltransferase